MPSCFCLIIMILNSNVCHNLIVDRQTWNMGSQREMKCTRVIGWNRTGDIVVTWMCLLNHKENRDTPCFCILGISVFSDWTCVTWSGEGRTEKSSAHLSILFSVTVSYFYSSNFLEPSIKPTEVEPEASTIIASWDGAVNGTEKQRGKIYAPFSAEVENIDPSLNHWRKVRERYLKRYSGRITADFLEQWKE